MEWALRQVRSLLSAGVDRPDGSIGPDVADVPFLLAGWKEPSLRRAAKIGDGWIGYLLATDSFARRRAFLRQCLEELGRTVDGFSTGMLLPVHIDDSPHGSHATAAEAWSRLTNAPSPLPERLFVAGHPTSVVDQIHSYWQAGCTEFMLAPADQGDRYLGQVGTTRAIRAASSEGFLVTGMSAASLMDARSEPSPNVATGPASELLSVLVRNRGVTLTSREVVELSEILHEEAAAAAGLADFGNDDYREALDRVLSDLARATGGGDELRTTARFYVHDTLVSRLYSESGWQKRPDVLAAPIESPVVVAGVPRTGTTLTHQLLSMHDEFQVLHNWLISYPMAGRPGRPGSTTPNSRLRWPP